MGPLLLILLGVPAAAQERDQTPVFRAETAVVKVDAQVWERSRVVTGLGKADFAVFDEGVPQPLLYFGHDSEPVDILLLLDVSGSMRRYLEEMARHAREALAGLNEGDRVGIMLFSRRQEVREDFTPEFGRVETGLKEAVRETGLGSGTLINPAICAAAAHFAGQEAGRRGRRAVLMVTDNSSLNYRSPDEEAIRLLLAADTVLNAIVVGRGERPETPRAGTYVNPDFTPADVFRLAEETGGIAVRSRDAEASFRQMIEGIRARYSLEYRAPEGAAKGSFRTIRVELTPAAQKRHPRATVLARRGYVVK